MSEDNRRPTHYLRGLAVLGLLIAGCATVIVENQSKEYTARVSVRLPDGDGGKVFALRPDFSTSFVSAGGGTFTVTVLPNEEYLAWLEKNRLLIEDALTAQTGAELLGAPGLSPGQVAALQLALTLIHSEIKDIELTGASFSGNLPENGEAACQLIWEDPLTAWDIDCSIHEGEPISA